MAIDMTKAADDARRLLRGFKAFAEVAEALEAAGQAEQRKLEAEVQLGALRPQIEAAKTDVLVAKAKAKEIVSLAEEQAAKRITAAEINAAQIVAEAKRKAVDIVAAADVVANNAALASRKAVEATEKAATERDALLKECQTLEARLAKAQASIAKLLG